MVKKMKQMVKNQKGLTLVELLAVIVILGIIAAIAIPAIGNVIDKSKNDAHIANGQQLIAAARLAVSANDVPFTNNTAKVTANELRENGYLEAIPQDPEKKDEYKTAEVEITKEDTSENGKRIVYKVTLSQYETATDSNSYVYQATPDQLNKGNGTGSAFK